MKKNLYLIFFLSFFLFSFAHSIAAEEPCNPEALWQPIYNEYYQDSNLDYQYQSAAPAKDGIFWLSVKTTLKDESQEIPEFELWKLNNTGKRIGTFSFKDYLGSKDSIGEFAEVTHMATLQEGNLVIALDSGVDLFYVLNIDKDGKRVKKLAIESPLDPQADWKIEKILPINKQEVFLIGRVSEKPFIIKHSLSGEVIWQKIIDELEQTPLGFSDGFLLDKKNLVLLGNGGTKETPFVSLSLYDLKGKLIREKTFRGRRAKIIPTENNDFLISYNLISSTTRNVLVQKLGPKFNELWKMPITQTETEIIPGFIPSNMAYYPKKGLILSTIVKEFNFFSSYIDTNGNTIWKCIAKKETSHDLFLLDNGIFFSEEFFTMPTTRGRSENINGDIWARTGINILRFRLTQDTPK